MSAIIARHIHCRDSLLETERNKFITTLTNYEDDVNSKIDENLIFKVIRWIGGAPSIGNYRDVEFAFKIFLRRDLNGTEENEIKDFITSFNFNIERIPQEESTYAVVRVKGTSDIVVAVPLCKITSVLGLKDYIRSTNAFYRNHNILFFMDLGELSDNQQLIGKQNAQIEIMKNTYDPKYIVDRFKDLRSNLRDAKRIKNEYMWPDYYSNDFYDKETKIFKNTKEFDEKKQEAIKNYEEQKKIFESFIKDNNTKISTSGIKVRKIGVKMLS